MIKTPNKITLKEYPYTYVRTVTMKSKLLKKQDYDKLLHMEINEITKYLQELHYGQEINALALKYKNVALLENALEKNTLASFEKLKQISPEELHELIIAYLKRHDIFNIKTILRAKFTHSGFSEIQPLLLVGVAFSHDALQKLLLLPSVEAIIEKLHFFSDKQRQILIDAFKHSTSLLAIENALDKYYYEFTFNFCDRLKGGADLFKNYLLSEIDVINLKLILRLKKEDIKKETILTHILVFGHGLQRQYIQSLLSLDYDAVIAKLSRHRDLGSVVRQHQESLKHKDMVLFEAALQNYLLQKASLLLHQHPLAGEAILGFMLAKDIEIKNLKTIIKGKQLGLDEQFITAQLVV
ncbi:V-type ATPase subunit [Candidatus Woesearchaeota archaeon]|nr:V-type ATPase subunit [Candidatus Woesearchaeota archaeon]